MNQPDPAIVPPTERIDFSELDHAIEAAKEAESQVSDERIYFPELDGLRFIAFMMVYLFHGGVPPQMLAGLIGSRAAHALRENGGYRGPAFLHPERIPDHDALTPGRVKVRSGRTPRILDSPHSSDLATVLPDPRNRFWPDSRTERTMGSIWLPPDAPLARCSFFGIPRQLVDDPDRSAPRLAEHSLERLRRGAVLPDRAALDRLAHSSATTPHCGRVDRVVDCGALAVRRRSESQLLIVFNTFAQFDTLLSGVLLAMVLGWDRHRPRLAAWLRWLQWPLYLIFFWVLSQPHLGHGTIWHRTWDFVWVWLCGLGIVIVAVWGHGWFSAALSYSRLVWLGKISYGLYMYHEVALWARERLYPLLPWFPNKDELLAIATLTLTIALAAASVLSLRAPILVAQASVDPRSLTSRLSGSGTHSLATDCGAAASFVLSAKLVAEPGSREPPVPLHCDYRDPQRCGDLGDGHPAEIPQCHDLRLALVYRREPVERLVDRDDIQTLFVEVVGNQIERDAPGGLHHAGRRIFAAPWSMSTSRMARAADANR